tara:strand:+ start:295 stop:561 length:267 start_codon:yes stop_codon:yes gene_type:complete
MSETKGKNNQRKPTLSGEIAIPLCQYHKIPIKKEKKMDFKLTIVLTHIEDQSEEDMFLNAETYIQDDIKDGVLNIESVEDITDYPDSK